MTGPRKDDRPAPLETGPGEQRDDNIDDLGRRPDGTEQEQPVKLKPGKKGDKTAGSAGRSGKG